MWVDWGEAAMLNRRQAPGELRERFYQSVAEALTLLYAAPGHDRRQALNDVSRILAVTMDLPLVWVGRREPGHGEVEVMAAAGCAAAYAATLRLSNDENEPGGRGPVGIALRQERAGLTLVDAPEFATWRAAAQQYGFGTCIVAASRTRDDGQFVLATYSRGDGPELEDDLLDWVQRLADGLSQFWDHKLLLERNLRMSRYRDAQRTIQRALLDQPDPDAVFHTLAASLVDIAGAGAVDVFAADGADGMLRRVALAGPIADVMHGLPLPPRHEDGPVIMAPTQAYMQGRPVILQNTAVNQPGIAERWHRVVFEHAGALGCWPLFAVSAGETDAPRRPVGIFVVFTLESDAFDDEMCRLLDEIAEAAGLALKQHVQRRALMQEQQRQTYLASHDDLTDLPNRRALDQYLDTVLARSERRGRQVAVGLLDLDDLKPINDRYGHAIGDRLLVELAGRLRMALGGEDYVARLGGDEFVLVIEDMVSEADLESLLDRIGESLLRPVLIDDLSLPLIVSLGIALHSTDTRVSGEQLLRRADQAMYQIKARKRHRTRWWMVARADGVVEPPSSLDTTVPPYGERAARLLTGCSKVWESQIPELVDSYYSELLLHEGVAWLLGLLSAGEVSLLKGHVVHHLLILIRPELELAAHRARATRTGLFHAACGLEEVWLLEAIELLRDLLFSRLGVADHADRKALMIVLERLGMERQWQLESMRELQRRRVALLARLNELAWSAEGYLQLIQGVVDIMASHEEINACAVGRPDASGQLTYEAVAGPAFGEYLRALGAGEALPIHVDVGRPASAGPSGRAWRTVAIHRCEHYGSDPMMAGWRRIALRLGVISSVAIPLCPSPQQPVALLTLYSPYAGGLHSEDQQAFVEQVKTVLDLVLARLAPPRQGTELLPFFVRARWRATIGSDALQMHYQPLVRLADGSVTEFEALARLRDDDGSLLAPARFLPALDADDLVVLFRHGLTQVAACRERLLQAGYILDMSVNVPAVALEDPRYAEVTAAVIADTGYPPQALLLEILESPFGTEHAAVLDESGMQSLQALGVRLVEDDLGAGYSSLIRLRQWPFDRIKIDQAIVRQARQDPLGTLRFIRQLIRIGHDLRLEVVVEGLESPDLIEAATILGADLGQGYALARPMASDVLVGWLGNYRHDPYAARPRTSMGALAGELRWEEQFLALPPEPAYWARHAQTSFAPDEYMHGAEPRAALNASHQAMHEAAMAGPLDTGYRRRREAFLSLLIGHVLDGGPC
jgi:diguanylate cyclase (GGDEF)-like protein